uniref:Uncharacterized protein n=1 Tax=Kalanchoe fedtschenkoi TaxID=63787 RepID=A0A7N0V8X5_KALFE
MTMVPSAQDDRTQLCTRHHHHYSDAAGYGGEIETVRRRFAGIYHHRSTSSSPTSPAVAAYCIINNNNSQADRAFCNYIPADEMRDRDDFRPENDPNQPSSSSMDPGAKRVEDSWLRLRLGGGDPTTSGLQSQPPQPAPDRRGLVELDLLPGSSRATNSHREQPVGNTGPQALFQAQEFRAPPRPVAWLPSPAPEINWAFMRPGNIMAGQQLGNYYVANPSMSLMPTGTNFFARPAYGYQMGLNNGGGDPGGGTSSSSSGGGGGMRIVRPPRRPHVGVWFRLQASQNQVREPFLSQIPKSYLRIK